MGDGDSNAFSAVDQTFDSGGASPGVHWGCPCWRIPRGILQCRAPLGPFKGISPVSLRWRDRCCVPSWWTPASIACFLTRSYLRSSLPSRSGGNRVRGPFDTVGFELSSRA